MFHQVPPGFVSEGATGVAHFCDQLEGYKRMDCQHLFGVLPTAEPSQATFLKGEETIVEPEESLDQVISWLQARRSEPRPPSSGPPRTVHRSSRRLPCAASPQSPDSTAISLADQCAPEQ
ncbi:hypothetical protein CRENBAI_014006 [Crenichthys baileyi]|uniref:Uncharacterized protein n=1 Tax=Crenichthys baileyi TaxID=28760 RepID=A0AAV9SLI3_9TELE